MVLTKRLPFCPEPFENQKSKNSAFEGSVFRSSLQTIQRLFWANLLQQVYLYNRPHEQWTSEIPLFRYVSDLGTAFRLWDLKMEDTSGLK